MEREPLKTASLFPKLREKKLDLALRKKCPYSEIFSSNAGKYVPE